MAQTDNLTEYLRALEENDALQVVDVLKSSPVETTELVRDARGRLLVRKTIDRESGTGGVYAQLKMAQDGGKVTPHLPRVYAFAKTESHIIVLMEYLQGENLWDRLDAEGTGVAAARKYFPALCRAVSELHEGFNPPIIHRDLKPTNIIITGSGILKLIDLGISREWRPGATADTQFLGTREYAPPEQFGYRQTDERSDVYSLGMILYHMLTGQTPSPLLREGGFEDPDIPESLRTVLMKATEFDPERRYVSAEALRLAFEQALGGVRGALPQTAAVSRASRAEKPAKASKVAAAAGEADIDSGSAKDTPQEAMIRDILAGILVVVAIGLIAATWPTLDPTAQLGYNAGQVMSGFILFLPFVSFAYALSSKRLLARWFPRIVGDGSTKRNILVGILIYLVLNFVVFLLCMAFVP